MIGLGRTIGNQNWANNKRDPYGFGIGK